MSNDSSPGQAANTTSSPTFLALACVGFLAAAPAHAAAPAADSADSQAIIVTGEPSAEVESPKATAPLLDTPQTITVISDQTLKKQNLLTLRDALSTIPGITFGAGEGGGGYGDSINLRGYSANNDITQDGVRDSAQYSRTDPFNLQQIEVYNGANSAFNGSGSVGGTINLVTKVPQPDDLTIAQAAIGTDNYYRATVDSNLRVNDLIAVRLNGMYHRNDVPGRDVEKLKRWGVAPSVTIGMDGPTSLTLAYIHQRDDNTPVYGVPYFKSLVNDGPLAEVDDSDYFGIANLDTQETRVDRLTATFRHELSSAVSIRNLTRWQRVHQYSQTSAPQGVFCLSNGRQPIAEFGSDPTLGKTCPTDLAPGFMQPAGPRGLVRDQLNQLLHNQTDLRVTSGKKGGLRNTLVIGASFTQEDYEIENAQLLRNPGGATPNPIQPPINLANPQTNWTGPVNYTRTGNSFGDSRNWAIYAFDTLELGERFELSAGLRYENARNLFRADTVTTPVTGSVYTRGPDQRSDENLFSYRVGAVFKPVENISLYAAYANAQTPSSASVRAGCGVPGSPTAADPCAVAPEKARNYEIGVKADLFERKLQLTAAMFHNERSNFRVPSNDPLQPAGLQVLDGRSRVNGLALGASGSITPEWTVFANYTYLDSKILQSVSDACRETPSVACLNTNPAGSTTIADPQRGNQLIQTPKHSGSLFTSYKLPFGLEIGYGLTYQGSYALNQTTLLNRQQFRSDDYLIHRAFLGYSFNNGLTAQLNVTNFTNERYFTGIRNNIGTALTGATPNNGVITGGWATPGEDRSAVLSLFYSF